MNAIHLQPSTSQSETRDRTIGREPFYLFLNCLPGVGQIRFRISSNERPAKLKYPATPDGRYFVHKERLWRCTNPNLNEETRQRLVNELMSARREIAVAKGSRSDRGLAVAREKVHAAKVALGERGPTWWDDDADYSRRLIKNTPYAQWWNDQSPSE